MENSTVGHDRAEAVGLAGEVDRVPGREEDGCRKEAISFLPHHVHGKAAEATLFGLSLIALRGIIDRKLRLEAIDGRELQELAGWRTANVDSSAPLFETQGTDRRGCHLGTSFWFVRSGPGVVCKHRLMSPSRGLEVDALSLLDARQPCQYVRSSFFIVHLERLEGIDVHPPGGHMTGCKLSTGQHQRIGTVGEYLFQRK